MKRYQTNTPSGFAKVFWRLLTMAIRTFPARFALFVVYNVINGVLSGLYAAFLQNFLDTATSGAAIAGVIGALAAFAGVLIGEHLVNGFDHTLTGDLHLRLRGDAMARLCDKAGKLPAEWYESSDFLTHLEKARAGTRYDWVFLIPLLRFFVSYLPLTLVMSVYLYTLAPHLALGMALIYIPTIAGYVLRSGVFVKHEDAVAPIRRQRAHYLECVASPTMFKETRALGAHSFFRAKFVDATARLIENAADAYRRASGIDMACAGITLLGYGGVLAMLIVSLARGQISAGAFAAVFATLGFYFSVIDETLGHLLAPVSGIATVRHFVSFMDLPEAPANQSREEGNYALRARAVSFRYADSQANAVEDITLDIAPGETVAVVGVNGSGKSTLVKLLTGLYAPDSGEVRAPGRATAVFQNYRRYQMTLCDNVRVSDPERSGLHDNQAVQASLTAAGVEMNALDFPSGTDTMLAREFGGVELSGGQWQRVAIARGIYRAADVMLLDEPTAAIDPMEETRLYEQFARLAQGKTCILVTHRLGSARIADRIVVMEAGRIVETGSHEQLIRMGGTYASMYQAQAQWYSA